MLTVIVAGRNDDYGKDFRQRLFRTALHNCALLGSAGIQFEYTLAEWNPLPHRPLLSEEFVDRVPNARSIVVAPEIHHKYTLNPQMPFHEMAAKNAALRRARGEAVVITNADILFSEELVHRIADGRWKSNGLYRAHRIDVKPDLDWSEIQNPANQLPSGEGILCPPYYLGAGGDFCLALRKVWHALGGLNERIRFSTRAKDWQFFLSAAAQDMDIEFIGNVYHLDHDGGFRNTHPELKNSEAVHFGKWWDIEFGLPVANRADWGFASLRERANKNDSRVIELEAQDYVTRDLDDDTDREMMTWLTRPSDSPETAAAVMLHAICAAHRAGQRLIFRIHSANLAVTLSGFELVASRFDVEIHCNWDWPSMSGYSVRPFTPEPAVLRDRDWILEETEYGVRLIENASGHELHVLPQMVPVNDPEFNPLLARRLLYAYLKIQKQGKQQMAIYGAGSHTRDLLRWGIPDNIGFIGLVESDSICERPPAAFLGASPYRARASRPSPFVRGTLQPFSPLQRGRAAARSASPIGRSTKKGGRGLLTSHLAEDAIILLSSTSFESDMLQTCRDHGIHNVIALYGDWPKDMWKIGAAV